MHVCREERQQAVGEIGYAVRTIALSQRDSSCSCCAHAAVTAAADTTVVAMVDAHILLTATATATAPSLISFTKSLSLSVFDTI